MSLCSMRPRPARPTPAQRTSSPITPVEAEVVDAAAAVLLGHGHAEEAGRARLGEQLARHDAGLAPTASWCGTISRSTKRAEAVAEELVVFAELMAAHASEVRSDVLGPTVPVGPPVTARYVPLMRVFLSSVAHERFWSVVSRPGLEPVLLEPDGGVRGADGTAVAPEVVDAEVAWGTGDLFLEGAPGRAFFELVGRAPSLRWLQSPAAGFDRPMFRALADRGVRITTTHVNGIPIVEYVLRSVLEHFQAANEWRAAEASGSSTTHEFREVYQTTWLVVGLGSIGGAVARRASAFGVTVIGCRRHPEPGDPADRVVTPAELPAVIGDADVVVLAAPATSDTGHLVDRDFLGAMKPQSVLVNVARGSLVDEEALLAALDRGIPEAAILDVFETEPLPPGHPFWTHPAVTVTPHNAAFGTGRLRRQAEVFADNYDRFVVGDALVHEVTDLARTPP